MGHPPFGRPRERATSALGHYPGMRTAVYTGRRKRNLPSAGGRAPFVRCYVVGHGSRMASEVLKQENVLMRSRLGLFALAIGVTVQAAHAQVDWLFFEDTISTSRCDVINTLDSELVLLDGTFELMLVTGTDTILADTFVDEQNFVFFGDQPAGSIEFAEDSDGFRTLWWLTLNGRVVALDPFTAEPQPSDALPIDFTNVPCDACEFIDSPPSDICDFDDGIILDAPFNIDICGLGVGSNAFLAMTFCGFLGLRSTRRW